MLLPKVLLRNMHVLEHAQFVKRYKENSQCIFRGGSARVCKIFCQMANRLLNPNILNQEKPLLRRKVELEMKNFDCHPPRDIHV
jgi:hypothetical protein